MKQNVGETDRKIRYIVGGAAILAGLMAPLPRAWRIGLLTLGASELITAGTRYCPVSHALGVNTNRTPVQETLEKAMQSLTE